LPAVLPVPGRANQANVTFHASPAEAEAAGYRPCKRCRPHEDTSPDPKAAKIIAACRMIEMAEQEPTLAVSANAAGLSPFHFQRIFKSMTGVTPKA